MLLLPLHLPPAFPAPALGSSWTERKGRRKDLKVCLLLVVEATNVGRSCLGCLARKGP